MTPSPLHWVAEGAPDQQNAYSGEIIVGFIGRREDGSWYYSATSAVNMRGVAKGRGMRVASRATAMHAVERAWSRWLVAAGLQPAEAA